MSEQFSEKTFLINLISEITNSVAFKTEQPLLAKLALRYRDYLLKTELAERLALIRRRESELKVSLLQCIRADQWNESARLTAEISAIATEKAAVTAKIGELEA